MTADRRTGGQADCNRRDFLAAAAGGLVLTVRPPVRLTAQSPDSLPGTGPSGRLWDPARAGKPLEPVTAADKDRAPDPRRLCSRARYCDPDGATKAWAQPHRLRGAASRAHRGGGDLGTGDAPLDADRGDGPGPRPTGRASWHVRRA